MNETKKTLRILINRWPEVFLIVGLYILGDLSHRLFSNSGNILFILFILSLAVILMLLSFGFLRTIHLEGSKKQTPMDLIKIGDRFFWRMVGSGIIYLILRFISVRIIFLIIKYFSSINIDFRETAKSNPLLYTLCIAATTLILIKILLFVPSLIIVLDCRVFESFKFLRKCKLSESKELVTLYFLNTALLFVWALLKITYFPETILQHSLRIGINIIHQILWLIIAVTAVRFVGSLKLVYDRDTKGLNSEDLLKNQSED